MNHLLRSTTIAFMLLAALSAPASAQEDTEAMRRRAVRAMIWAMNRANDAGDAFSISYGGQPGAPGTKQGQLTSAYFVHEADYVFQLRSGRSPREAIRRVFYPRPSESVGLERRLRAGRRQPLAGRRGRRGRDGFHERRG